MIEWDADWQPMPSFYIDRYELCDKIKRDSQGGGRMLRRGGMYAIFESVDGGYLIFHGLWAQCKDPYHFNTLKSAKLAAEMLIMERRSRHA